MNAPYRPRPRGRASLALLMGVAAAVAACQGPPTATPGASPDAATAVAATGAGNTKAAAAAALGWSEATHGKDVEPAYDVAFPQGKVSEFRIVIEPSDWEAMMADMTKLYGPRGAQGGMGGGPRGPRPAQAPPGGGVGRTARPMWVPATIVYGGRAWTNVGVRFKGNSSLIGAWRSNTDRMPLKLDFQEFEDQHPEIEDQKFHGFKQLSLSTNSGDDAGMRDAIAYEVLAEAGHAASKTAHYEVLLDHGQGATSLGLYTNIEVTDDTVVKRVFGDDEGNVYEGDGAAVSLAEGTRGGIATSFPKENNKDSDWSDVEALYDALHAPARATDAPAWRAGLEAVFDVETFLEWLAIAAALQHWDTYGGMSHNFYLYNDPATKKLTWISWDHNLILGSGGPGGMGGPGGAMPGGGPPVGPDGQPMAFPSGFAPPSGMPGPGGDVLAGPGGMAGRGGGMGRNASLGKEEVTAAWPLIRFLLDDPTYRAKYVAYLAKTARGPFEAARMQARVDRYAAYLAPFAAKQADGGAAYAASVRSLTTAIAARTKAVADYLADPTPKATPTPAAPTN